MRRLRLALTAGVALIALAGANGAWAQAAQVTAPAEDGLSDALPSDAPPLAGPEPTAAEAPVVVEPAS